MVCPLCRGVVQLPDNYEDMEDFGMDEIDRYESKSRMYPDVTPVMKTIKLVIKFFIFFSILIECILILINYLTYNGLKWSLICGAAMVYMCFTVVYSFQHHKGHKSKMFAQMIGAIVLVVLIDLAVGYTGWSVNYALPVAIMLFDLVIIIVMLINNDNWQNYIILEIAMLVVSIFTMILVFTDVVTAPLLTIIAFGITCIILLATVIFGDKTAITELSRRFRI